jgi:hypothetical protein
VCSFPGHRPGRKPPQQRPDISVPAVPVSQSIPPPDSGLPPVGPLRLGRLELGEGRPAVARRHFPATEPRQPALWVTDGVVAGAARVWSELADRFPVTGLWPLVLRGLAGDERRPWDDGELEPAAESDVDARDPCQVLATGWNDSLVPLGEHPRVAHLTPYAAPFPGLAAPLPRVGRPAAVPTEALAPRRAARLGLVRCRRPADAVALVGWLGAINVTGPAEVAAVLRSWEERFGVVLAALGFDTLSLLVPHPPVDEHQALPIAAEIAALCPDALWQGPGGTLAELARTLVGQPIWRLWFD